MHVFKYYGIKEVISTDYKAEKCVQALLEFFGTVSSLGSKIWCIIRVCLHS